MCLSERLRALESAAAKQPCPGCGASDDPDAEPRIEQLPPGQQPKACPLCGTLPKVIRMRPVRIGSEATT